MEQLDAITEMLTNNPVAGILEEVTANLPPAGFPPAEFPELPTPGVGGGSVPALPFGNQTSAALQSSAGDFADFASANLTDYGTRSATAIRTTAEAYSDAFQSLAEAFQGLAPTPGGAPDLGGDIPGMATAMALADGLDGLGQAVALSLGNGTDSGALYAAETIGGALTGAGEDIAAGFAAGAEVIDALAGAIVENLPDSPTTPGGDGPETQFVEALEGGFEQVIAGYNVGADALSSALPEAIADGIQTVGASFLEGAMTVTSALVSQIDGFALPDGGTTGGAFEIPAPFADAAAQLTGLLGGGVPTAPEIPAPFADAAAQLQGALEDGAAQLTDLFSGGVPTAPEIPAPFADAAAQLQGAFEDGAAQLMDLPGAIQAGITSLASQFPTELPTFPS